MTGRRFKVHRARAFIDPHNRETSNRIPHTRTNGPKAAPRISPTMSFNFLACVRSVLLRDLASCISDREQKKKEMRLTRKNGEREREAREEKIR